MLELLAGLALLVLLAFLGVIVYARGRKYEETKRLEQVVICREDDLTWSLKHTTAAYCVRNSLQVE